LAFFTFDSHENAVSAVSRLEGLQFDPETGHETLTALLAKNNTRTTQPTTINKMKDGGVIKGRIKDGGLGKAYRHNDYGDHSMYSHPHSILSPYGGRGGPSGRGGRRTYGDRGGPQQQHQGYPIHGGTFGNQMPAATTTIRVAPVDVQDQQTIKDMASALPGFLRCKTSNKAAWIEFSTQEVANNAVQSLSGRLLSIGPITAEFAKQQMRRDKEI